MRLPQEPTRKTILNLCRRKSINAYSEQRAFGKITEVKTVSLARYEFSCHELNAKVTLRLTSFLAVMYAKTIRDGAYVQVSAGLDCLVHQPKTRQR